MQSTQLAFEVEAQVDAYLAAFNRMDLDAVMQHFAEDAVYEPGDGCVYQGRDAIRRAFVPQFSHAFGTMIFDQEDRIVDEHSRKVTLQWVCRIDAGTARFHSWSAWLRLTLGRLRFGNRLNWKGLDVLHLNERGEIVRKLTYANYAALRLYKEGRPGAVRC